MIAAISIPNGIESPKAITATAPVAAPADTPIIDGSAMGFLKNPCITVPAAASANPTIAARIIRGNLRVTKMVISVGVRRLVSPKKIVSITLRNKLEDNLTGPIPELTKETIINRVERVKHQAVTR